MIVNANGIHIRALVVNSAGRSYASAALINCIGTSTARREPRQIEMLFHTTSRNIEVHNLTISNQEGSFNLNVDIHKAEKDIILVTVTLLQSYNHLRGCSLMMLIPKQNYQSTLFLEQATSQRSRPTCQLRLGKLVSQWQS